MMDGTSMMTGVMGLGWLAALVLVLLLVLVVVALVRLIWPRGATPDRSDAGGLAAKTVLAVLAVIGAVALLAVLGWLFMRAGMLGCCW